MMRQLTDRTNIIPTQKTPRAAEGTQTSSGSGVASWSARLCLPLLSENKRVLWVHPHEVNMQPDGVAELIKAFGRCPYQTHKQTAALALRCSLHPDQVKVWFMAQRLRYGISWDCKDIAEVCNKMKSSHEDDEEFQDGVKDDQKEDKATTAQKRRRRAVMSRRRRKRRKRDDWRITDQAEKLGAKTDTTESEGQTSSTCEGADLAKRKRAKTKQIYSPVKKAHDNPLQVPHVAISSVDLKPQTQTSSAVSVPESQAERNMTPVKSSCDGETEARANLEGALSAGAAEENYVVPDVEELKKLVWPEPSLVTANSPTTGTRQEQSHSADRAGLHTQARLKTQSQLSMLKRAFLQFQYPDAEQYSWLTRLVGLRRCHLVQWFGDLRYALKRSKPRWMTEEQYKKVLANIKDRQHKTILSKRLLKEAEKLHSLDYGVD